MQTTYEETINLFHTTTAISKEAATISREIADKSHETDRKIKELNTLFTSQWGKLIESLVAGDLINLLNQSDIAVNGTVMRLSLQK